MFKRIALAALALTIVAGAQAQRRQGVGLHFGGYDFYGPQTKNYLFSERLYYDYNDESKGFDTVRKDRLFWKPLVKFSYWWSINKMFDVTTQLSMASLRYPASKDDASYVNDQYYNRAGSNVDKFLGELDLRFAYNILPKEDFILSPYLTAGVNGSYHDIYFGADFPLGVGLNVNLSKQDNLFLNLESLYKIAATNHDVNHLQHSVGFVYWFTPGYKKAAAATADNGEFAPVTNMSGDADGDGIMDNEDDCPSIPGTAEFNGCPDSDGDGISDKEDACPLVAGTEEHRGCPDTDGDGIPDNEDKCPYVAGTADRQGCPAMDKDGDGFTDDVDRCPDTYSKTNNGCPEISKAVISEVERAARSIYFESGKGMIQKRSFAQLDAIARILKNDPSLYADIEGHTDNAGDDDANMQLSQDRAEAVRSYLMGKGIDGDRLTAQGYGETQPVANNGTAAGQAQNRRTVIKLRNYEK